MLNKKSTSILVILLACFVLTTFTACNSDEAKTEAAPAVPEVKKDTAPKLDTAGTRPLKPTNP